jgi:hypothetical protein
MIEPLNSATSVARRFNLLIRQRHLLAAYYLLEPLHYRRFGLRTDNTIDLSAFVEYEQSGDALNAESRRRSRILIDIELADAYSPGHLFRYFFDCWRDRTIRPAPWRPQIEQHRQPRALDY